MTFTLIDFFCGAGGSSQGAVAVPGVTARLAANHWGRAIESHAANFPHTEHYQGDLHDADLEGFPAGDIFWASPNARNGAQPAAAAASSTSSRTCSARCWPTRRPTGRGR